MHRHTLLLALLALIAPGAYAQDTTCDEGDIAWVSADENADEGHTLGGGTAEYNNSSTPFGIQAVFDEACSCLDVRILCDATNEYGSASTSWTNRDADKAIDIDQGSISQVCPISISTWTNTSTRGPCALDFNSGTGNGFNISRHVTMTGVEIKNTSSVGLRSTTTSANFYYKIKVTDAGNVGIDLTAEREKLVMSEVSGSTGAGVSYGQDSTLIAFNYIHDNTGDGINAGTASFEDSNIIGNLIVDNGGIGIDDVGGLSNTLIAFNTVAGNTSDGMQSGSNSSGNHFIGNIFTGNGGYGVNFDNALAGLDLTEFNTLYSNTSGSFNNPSGTIRILNDLDDFNGTPPADIVTFTDSAGDDWTLDTFTAITVDWFGSATTPSILKGAVQDNAASGGGGTTIMIQGVR